MESLSSESLSPEERHTAKRRAIEAEILELVAHLGAGEYRLLKLLIEFDQNNGWRDGSTPSLAHWLNWKCGIDLGAAREKVRVARALENLPLISAAMAKGELSYSKARAITRVACPQTENYFLSLALHGTAHHVETLVRGYRRAKEAEDLTRERRQQLHRSVRYHVDDDGSYVMKVRLPAEAGALLIKALEAATETLPPPDVSAETSPYESPRAARRADALALVAESYLKHGTDMLTGGERHQIVVHVDAASLVAGTAGRCEVDHGPSLSAETVRRLGCDASVVAIIENERGEPLSVGRKTRSIPPAIRRALNARDRGCRFPGCPNTRYVDGHHIHHWANGGETKLTNLVSLCRFHHRQVHEGRVQVQVLDDGALRFLRPSGQSFLGTLPEHTQPLGDWTQLVAQNGKRGIQIDRKTAATRWRGESMDYGLAVEVLLQHSKRKLKDAGNVAAETSRQRSSMDLERVLTLR